MRKKGGGQARTVAVGEGEEGCVPKTSASPEVSMQKCMRGRIDSQQHATVICHSNTNLGFRKLSGT